MTRTGKTRGFTLVELLLALAIVSFMLIFGVATITELMSNYNKGLAIKEINEVGRASLEDMSRYIKSIDSSAIDESLLDKNRLCLGGISYVWNGGDPEFQENTYNDNSPLVLARVSQGSGVCVVDDDGNPIPVARDESIDLLSSRVRILDLKFDVNDRLVRITMKLGIADAALSNGTCRGGQVGQYCATAAFNATVLTKGVD